MSSETAGFKPQVPLILTAVFLVFMGQMTLNPIIAPLAREVGLAEWQIGMTISAAAATTVLTAQFWGRKSLSWGRKPVLVFGFATCTVAMALFAVVSWLGLRGLLGGIVLFGLFLLLRGVAFGLAMGSIPPTAVAYIANVTPTESERVKGMAGIGAAQAIAIVAGSLLGGSLAIFGLLTPIVVVPIVLGTGLLLLIFRLRPEPAKDLIRNPAHVSPFDKRVWPYLAAGFGIFLAFGFIQIVTGFLVQDRLGLTGEQTGLVTGAALVATGIATMISQMVIVPRSGWHPVKLMRYGSLVGAVGFVVLLPDLGMAGIIASLAILGLGLGMAIPGYTSGPTLEMAPEEQGAVGGLISATNGLTYVIAPTLASILYGVNPLVPVVIGLVAISIVSVFVFTNRRLAQAM